jgi:hypothetical protein
VKIKILFAIVRSVSIAAKQKRDKDSTEIWSGRKDFVKGVWISVY